VTTVPFSPLDEAVYHIEETLGPLNIQLELGTTETIDVDRLREAAVTACNAHPLARARRQPSCLTEARYDWEILDDVGTVPTRTVDDDLSATRGEFYGRPFDLTAEPPVRLRVARGAGRDGGDRVLVCVSHVAADGVAAVRIVRSICQAYRGETPDDDPVGLETSREALDDARPSTISGRLDMLGTVTQRLGDLLNRPTGIATAGDPGGDGWGFVERTLGDDLVSKLVTDRPDGVSVNDVLLAAFHLAIADWNGDHGERAGRINVLMPVNARPPEWFYEVVGMYALIERVETRSRHRTDPRSAVETVAEQTATIKRADGDPLYEALETIPSAAPVGLKRQLPQLLRGVGTRLLDTAVLSNLGRVPEIPSLSGEGTDSLWFSPPCLAGMPVGIGVATTDGTVRLVFRYTADQFDAEAAERFADRYLERLTATTTALQGPIPQ
jgi:NRPS condensation-like uncharacterized protein